MSKIAKNIQRFVIGIENHNRANPAHKVHGIGLAAYDILRLDFDEGEEILPGICIENDNGLSGAFRILCDGNHTNDIEVESEVTDAIGVEA